MNLLVDSSIWIDFFNGAQSPEVDFLDKALGFEPIVVGDLILCEVLQGFHSQSDFEAAHRALTRFPIVSMVGQHIAIQSALNYRTLRRQGITIRKTMDSLIATYCIENEFMLLHRDRDFDYFEQNRGLAVWHPE